jgi:hypothetical protein
MCSLRRFFATSHRAIGANIRVFQSRSQDAGCSDKTGQMAAAGCAIGVSEMDGRFRRRRPVEQDEHRYLISGG